MRRCLATEGQNQNPQTDHKTDTRSAAISLAHFALYHKVNRSSHVHVLRCGYASDTIFMLRADGYATSLRFSARCVRCTRNSYHVSHMYTRMVPQRNNCGVYADDSMAIRLERKSFPTPVLVPFSVLTHCLAFWCYH